MNSETQNCWWNLEYLSDIELYYTEPSKISGSQIEISGDESKHLLKVMRHQPGDIIYATDGAGNIYEGVLETSSNSGVLVQKQKQFNYKEKFPNITFCLPKLKNPDRFEFALEKCVEMGITKFIVFESSRTVSKGDKTDRWNKILLSAMKQSLLSYLPTIKESTTLKKLAQSEAELIIFDQNSELPFKQFENNTSKEYLLVFGPEGGLSEEELSLFKKENIYKLSENRLRSETAIIKAAALL